METNFSVGVTFSKNCFLKSFRLSASGNGVLVENDPSSPLQHIDNRLFSTRGVTLGVLYTEGDDFTKSTSQLPPGLF